MDNWNFIAILASGFVALALLAWFGVLRRGKTGLRALEATGRHAAGHADSQGQLIAVIAAAVAAASGMAPGSFRIAALSPSAQGGGQDSGFNTPPWGHVERIARSLRTRG